MNNGSVWVSVTIFFYVYAYFVFKFMYVVHLCYVRPPSFESNDISNRGKLTLYSFVILYICGVLSPLCRRAFEYELKFVKICFGKKLLKFYF